MKRFTSKNQKIGELGEQIAQKYLINQGFHVIECNYTRKIGEIDVVALKNGVFHFVEVKTLIIEGVSRGTHKSEVRDLGLGNKESLMINNYSPFQNITLSKLKKFSRTCAFYLLEKHVSHETRWVMDAIAVSVSRETRSARVEVLWNISK